MVQYVDLPKTKKIAGKIYKLTRPLKTKAIAEEIAKDQRKWGGGARIIKIEGVAPYKYALWLR